MKKVLFFLLLLACNRGYTQLSVVTGYDYIGRNTFHTGLAADIDISDHWGALLTGCILLAMKGVREVSLKLQGL